MSSSIKLKMYKTSPKCIRVSRDLLRLHSRPFYSYSRAERSSLALFWDPIRAHGSDNASGSQDALSPHSLFAMGHAWEPNFNSGREMGLAAGAECRVWIRGSLHDVHAAAWACCAVLRSRRPRVSIWDWFRVSSSSLSLSSSLRDTGRRASAKENALMWRLLNVLMLIAQQIGRPHIRLIWDESPRRWVQAAFWGSC